MLMPFGKYKGTEVSELPLDYLLWLQDTIPLREPLRSAVAEAVYYYRSTNSSTGVLELSGRSKELQNIYYRLAKKWHPDCGGSIEAMQAINEFYEEICNCLTLKDGQ